MSRPGPTTKVTTRAVHDGNLRTKPDVVASEEPLEIRVAAVGQVERSIAVTMRTPGSDFELAVGFLTTEGVLRSRDDLAEVRYCVGGPAEQEFNVVTVALREGARFDPARLTRNVYTTSSCGVCGKASLDALEMQDCPVIPSGPTIGAALLGSLPGKLLEVQKHFATTGGLHAAGLFDPAGSLLLAREDVGRHNAVDKVVGALVLEQRFPARDGVLVVSGRASFEILQKAVMASIPIVAAVGAPSSLAIDTAKRFGQTLAGFVRDGSFNVYTGADRILT